MATGGLEHVITTAEREPSGSDIILLPGQSDPLPASEGCVICLDRITDQATALPCRHDQFDFPCLGTWLQQQPVCPLCKTSVTAIRFKVVGRGDGKSQLFYLPPAEQPQQPANRAGNGLAQQQRLRRHRTGGRGGGNRGSTSGFARPEISKDTALDFRRHVYRHKLYSLHVGSNRISRYRNLTPASFAKDERLTSRARMFIRRELQVFDFLNPSTAQSSSCSKSNDRRANNVDFLLEYIIGILKSIDLKGSTGQAEELLKDFLGRENTRIFLHDLEAWLRSPYEHLRDWDRAVQYAMPADADGEGSERANSLRSMDVCRPSSQSRLQGGGSSVPRWFADNFVLRDHSASRR
ncbi:C3HC4 type (RING finger) zinc finger containing protein [Cladophialophora carrionii]|uniref:RING-type E3 ubiquitin transferase n=1 Tax=Cladophialophora carrionii TaxID=86049 RepID=A0A1C1CGE8_9EURO|nr:C3HC4 type (RING finger) zinc finger containing protein [Cladophialophora carrionii]